MTKGKSYWFDDGTTKMTKGYHPELAKMRKKLLLKKALHLKLIEEVKQEMTGAYVKLKQPKIQQEDRQKPIISKSGLAMTIRLKHNIKLSLKDDKLT